ncbi:hypothetical protein C2G38_2165562 [Gigaspora rosea]|uniref:Ion transport domain-containing protein n=1 Tax=Gigaspora rosea TaxID=44941 RepID=A0A397VZX2_9GLOM|nr:hypothetical protein C2G38_2165562 [Gigaspora rosea]
MYLKDLKKDEQIWKELSNDDFDPNKNNIRDLHTKESKLDEYYHILEPWLLYEDKRHSYYSFYLDEKKEKLLLIGNHTIQVWHDQRSEKGPKKRSLEFIHVPLSHLPFNCEQSFLVAMNYEQYKIKVIDINYCLGKFKLNFQIENIQIENIEGKSFKLKMAVDKNDTMNVDKNDTKNVDKEYNIQIENIEDKSFQIKMADKNDTMNVVKYACYSLKYLSSYKKFELHFKNKKFADIIKQTQKIILRFIKLHPTEWRLLDIRYDLMSVLIEAKEYKLVKDILSSKEWLHIPLNIPWEDEKIISWEDKKDEKKKYYSYCPFRAKDDKENIGWMNTVVDIIPELYKCKEDKSEKENHKSEKENHNIGWVNKVKDIRSKLFKSNKIEREKEKAESYIYYAQKLFYHPCFYEKQLNIVSFKFLEISPKANGLLKVFIPITQLIPQDFKLNLQDIDYNTIVNIRMVNFTTNKKIFDIREKNFVDYLKDIISPFQFSSLEKDDYSPFIKLIENENDNVREILYENPSMGAVMNWMWYCSKFYWSRSLFTLLGYPFYIGLNQSPTTYEVTEGNDAAYTMTGEEPDNPFSNIIGSIVAVYDWSSISLDSWNFWPLTIISLICSFVFVIILQNIIISYMSDAFSDAVKDSNRGLYRFQIDFIHDLALLEKSLGFNNLDSKFKDKIRAKYICFYDDPNITSSWKEESEKMESEPYPITQIENKDDLESLSKEDCEFIWGKV